MAASWDGFPMHSLLSGSAEDVQLHPGRCRALTHGPPVWPQQGAEFETEARSLVKTKEQGQVCDV